MVHIQRAAQLRWDWKYHSKNGDSSMKKYIIAIFAALILLPSCSLDEKLFTYVQEDGYIDDAASARTVLFGLYRNLCNQTLYGCNLSMAFDMPTDLTKADGFQLVGGRVFTCNAHDPSFATVENTWEYLYRTIFNANDFIEKTAAAQERLSEQDKKVVDVYVAEARVIRALMYFELVRNWKNITLITTTEQSRQLSSTYVQDKPEDVYGFIETELKEAAEVLPWAKNDNLRPDNAYMVSKASALGLLARVYVTWAGYPMNGGEQMWQNAKSTCEIIMNSGYHDLLEDYEALWDNSCNAKWDPTESLFEISFYSPTISSSAALNSSGLIGKWNGVYNLTNTTPLVRVDARERAVATFASKWPDKINDKRFYLSMADFYYEGTDSLGYIVKDKSKVWYVESGIEGIRKVYKTDSGQKVDFLRADAIGANSYSLNAFIDGLYIAKWDLMKYVAKSNQMSDGNYSNANWYLIRYSDVLLMFAEAENELNGPTQDAYDAVNAVRRRGYGLYKASVKQEPQEKPEDNTEGTDEENTDSSTKADPIEGEGTDAPEQTEPSDVTIADLPSGLSTEDFRQAVWDERAYELCFEGNRKQDLIRWGIYAKTIKETGDALVKWGQKEQFREYYLAEKYTIEGKHELQPIPQREMDLLPKYKQNPNW